MDLGAVSEGREMMLKGLREKIELKWIEFCAQQVFNKRRIEVTGYQHESLRGKRITAHSFRGRYWGERGIGEFVLYSHDDGFRPELCLMIKRKDDTVRGRFVK